MAGGATAFGALLGGVGGSIYGEFVLVVLWAVIGAVLGLTLGLVPMALGYGCAGLHRSRTARLEREADELERS